MSVPLANYHTNYIPSYIVLYKNDFPEFQRRVQRGIEVLKYCYSCPRECKINRENDLGFCRIGVKVRVSSAFPHFGEEDCLRGWNGSGTIFFNLCNLRCVFCQNFDISQNYDPDAKELTSEELAELMVHLQKRGVHNINFVSPDHVVPQILEAIFFAVPKGLQIPIVYNSNAFSSIEMLQLLDGIIDIYMPDFKFWSEDFARRYLKEPEYPEIARQAIQEMYRQVGDIIFDPSGLAKRGLLVRHLVMPGYVEESKKILEFLAGMSKKIYLNLMKQYRPAARVLRRPDIYKEINRTVSNQEYKEVVQYAYKLGFQYIEHDFYL